MKALSRHWESLGRELGIPQHQLLQYRSQPSCKALELVLTYWNQSGAGLPKLFQALYTLKLDHRADALHQILQIQGTYLLSLTADHNSNNNKEEEEKKSAVCYSCECVQLFMPQNFANKI